MRIGIDIDGVLTDNDLEWCTYYQAKSVSGECGHAHVPDGSTSLRWDYWMDLCAPCFSECLYGSPVDKHLPRSDSFDVLNRWFNRGSKIYIITSRDPSLVQRTEEWLRRFGFLNIVEDVKLTHDKAHWCNEYELDLHLDDAPQNIYSISQKSSTTPVIYLTAYNEYMNNIAENPLTDVGKSIHLPGAFYDEVANWPEFDSYLETFKVRR